MKEKINIFIFLPYAKQTMGRQRFCVAFNTKKTDFFYTKPYFTMTSNDWTVAEI